MLFLSGCSAIKHRLFGTPLPNATIITKPFTYNFIGPRRAALDQNTSAKLTSLVKTGSSNANTYYSASGFACRNLSLNTNRSACFIDGQWQVAAPVLESTYISAVR